MMNDGLLAEAKSLYPYKNLRALQTVGYQELFDYFDNKISEEDAINKIKQHTRNYAKRQLTWFRSVEEAIYIKAQDHVVQNILNHIK
jgi:tRNA dimethylallyltransferase